MQPFDFVSSFDFKKKKSLPFVNWCGKWTCHITLHCKDNITTLHCKDNITTLFWSPLWYFAVGKKEWICMDMGRVYMVWNEINILCCMSWCGTECVWSNVNYEAVTCTSPWVWRWGRHDLYIEMSAVLSHRLKCMQIKIKILFCIAFFFILKKKEVECVCVLLLFLFF